MRAGCGPGDRLPALPRARLDPRAHRSRWSEVLSGASTERDGAAIVVETIRLPRSLTALFAGAALGIAGLQMQTLFRNPLADPFALGISSGASLGVAIVVLGSGMSVAAAFGASTGLRGDALLIGAAIAGALAVLALVLVVSSRVANPTTVLILGLMFGYAASAIVTVLVGISSPERLMQLAQWGFGSFSGVTWQRLRLFAPAHDCRRVRRRGDDQTAECAAAG